MCVNFPDPMVCHQSKWVPFVRDDLKADEQTVVVGHSTGALLAMRLLETHKPVLCVCSANQTRRTRLRRDKEENAQRCALLAGLVC